MSCGCHGISCKLMVVWSWSTRMTRRSRPFVICRLPFLVGTLTSQSRAPAADDDKRRRLRRLNPVLARQGGDQHRPAGPSACPRAVAVPVLSGLSHPAMNYVFNDDDPLAACNRRKHRLTISHATYYVNLGFRHVLFDHSTLNRCS